MILSAEQFAVELVTTGDLDPDYIFIRKTAKALGMSEEEVARWILLKTVVYRSASELEILLFSERFDAVKFGAERRKSRRRAEADWERIRSDLKGGFHSFLSSSPRDASKALSYFQSALPNVGPWASWKLADLSERVLGIPIDFASVDFRKAYLFPLRGIALLSGEPEERCEKRFASDVGLYERSLERARGRLGRALHLNAPPARDRVLGPQEIETLFCKFHSYAHRRYRPGEDLEKLRESLSASRFREIRELRKFAP